MGYGSQWATAGVLGDGRGTQTRREQGMNHKDFWGKRLPGGRDSQCKVPEAGEGPVHSGRVRRPETGGGAGAAVEFTGHWTLRSLC